MTTAFSITPSGPVIAASLCVGSLMAAAAQALPDAPGRAEVQAVCTSCHDTRPIEMSAGYTRGDWRILIRTMIDLPADTEDLVSAYLAEHFPPNDRRTPTLVGGPVELDFQTWVVPTPGSTIRGPARSASGPRPAGPVPIPMGERGGPRQLSTHIPAHAAGVPFSTTRHR